MDINSVEGDQLFRLMLLALPAGLITERIIHLAWIRMEGGVSSQKKGFLNFVNNDATIFVTTLLSSGIALLPALIKFGPAAYLDILSQVRNKIPIFGWAFTILVLVQALAVIMVPVFLLIGRRRRQRPVTLSRIA
jgi:hypothetical protein